jgi:NAD-dependent histone deacetylase SIR2
VFYSLAGDILPDQQRFSPTHAFIRLLQDKGRLQTNYTQNIDNLEAAAGIDEDRIIQCHGSFATATCRKCSHKVKGVEIYPDIRAKRIPKCEKCITRMASEATTTTDTRPPKRSKTSAEWDDDENDDDENDDIPQPGIMKPDITFFGEQLPNTFFDRLTNVDAERTDLVLVIGTSLKVAPVSEMPNFIPHTVPHIYISLEPIRHVEFDIQLLGSCDDVVRELCRRAGWELKHEMIPENVAPPKVTQVPGREHIWAIEADGGGSATGTAGKAVEVLLSRPLETAMAHKPKLAKDDVAIVRGDEELLRPVTLSEN